jgi:hypothetical protein
LERPGLCPKRFLFPLIRRTGDPLLNALSGLSIIRQHATTMFFPHFVGDACSREPD